MGRMNIPVRRYCNGSMIFFVLLHLILELRSSNCSLSISVFGFQLSTRNSVLFGCCLVAFFSRFNFLFHFLFLCISYLEITTKSRILWSEAVFLCVCALCYFVCLRGKKRTDFERMLKTFSDQMKRRKNSNAKIELNEQMKIVIIIMKYWKEPEPLHIAAKNNKRKT